MKNRQNIIHSITRSISSFFLKNKKKWQASSLVRNKIICSSQFRIPLLVLILLFCGVSMWLIKINAQQDSDIQESIADKIIRFHVIANSDSDADQALKLKVKDQLVKDLAPLLDKADSVADARNIISNNLGFIKAVAENTIQENKGSYCVNVTLEDCYFPLKVYGNCTFPPGIYEALRVKIGAAEGKNWWCVMFPPLCFVDETYSIVDERTDQKLKHLLTEEEYDTLIHEKKPVKIKFKMWENLKKLLDKKKKS